MDPGKGESGRLTCNRAGNFLYDACNFSAVNAIENKEAFMTASGPLEFFTIVAQNYLAHAQVLGESVLKHHPDATFSVFLMDDSDHAWQSFLESRGFRAIYPEQITLQDYRKFVFQYDITEASTGVKPLVIQSILDRGVEKAIYLDPDILCFRRLDEVLTALDQFSVVVTPHVCSPVPEGLSPDEREFMTAGVYNLGFIAVRNSEETRRFVGWWGDRLARECLLERDAGLFVDQKWVDMVPACFDHVFIMRDPAYNIAYWNLHERTLEERQSDFYEARSGHRVAFVHLSGFSPGETNLVCRYVPGNPLSHSVAKKRYRLSERQDLVPIFKKYAEMLASSRMEDFARIPYGYSTYSNGDLISKLERSLYLTSPMWREADIDPFATGPGSFWQACRRAGVRASKGQRSDAADKVVGKYRRQMRVIEFLLRLGVRVLGPDLYYAFAKYMRHQLLPQNQGFLLKASTHNGFHVGQEVK